MSDWDEKTEKPKPSDGHLARRPLKSFIKGGTYEFRIVEAENVRNGKRVVERPTLVSYRETDERTFWRRVDGLDGDWFEIIPERTEKEVPTK